MRSFKEYVEEVVPLIIESSNGLADRELDQTQKRLLGLIMSVFSFSANAVIKLDIQTQESLIPLLKDIENQINQLNKIKDADL